MATTTDHLSGHPGHLNEAQQTALTQFRENLTKDALIPADKDTVVQTLGYDRFDDQTLLRFLRARKFDLVRAQAMWADNEKWRKEFGADEIAANGFDYPEGREVTKYYPQFYHKTDREGRPVYIEQLGKLDVNKLYALTNQDRQLKKLVSEYELFLKDRLPASSKESGHLVETSCTIMDLYNAGISTFYKVKDYVSAASSVGQNNSQTPISFRLRIISLCEELMADGCFVFQPETMGHMFIINAPYLFSTVWSLIKPWLDEATVRKIHILGKNYKKELQEYIPAENLPASLGGTCNCAGGCEYSNAGPWNPTSQA
ncbi:Sec14 cytosolic factor [Cryptococcus wingfieldii CBS 7118]|uniref:Sec14 cytosolic factor n=1 Tax=Cryptococcus wingfieldii CBS 7118 TaxID=1295528 RepID=A0A1E3JBI5_9TREE|nr:Sec14 cytosolic factor [Cryptococcus wingfieldii CBS 7118]ODN98238.1 Sec14 cytosolic factor [Cryptococcus wingfieldii CBS 7118]